MDESQQENEFPFAKAKNRVHYVAGESDW